MIWPSRSSATLEFLVSSLTRAYDRGSTAVHLPAPPRGEPAWPSGPTLPAETAATLPAHGFPGGREPRLLPPPPGRRSGWPGCALSKGGSAQKLPLRLGDVNGLEVSRAGELPRLPLPGTRFAIARKPGK